LQTVEATGAIDYFNVTNGTHESYEWMMPNAHTPAGAGASYGVHFRPHLRTPVIGVGKVHDAVLAERLLASGQLELVGMARPLIAEPNLPTLLRQRRERHIRPCVAINHCLNSIATGPLRCAVNPHVGREDDRAAVPARGSGRSVAIVGGGPAGLEAAATAAEAGLAVTLFEQHAHLGGQWKEAGSFPGQEAKLDLIDYYRHRLARAGVTIELNRAIEPASTDLDRFDEVIVATGSRREPTPWHDRNIQSDRTWSGPRLFTGALFALRQIDLHGMNVLLVAREPADYVAATLAHFLAPRASELTIVTSFEALGTHFDLATKHALARVLEETSTRTYTRSWITAATRGDVIVRQEELRTDTVLRGVDLVVTTGARRPALLPLTRPHLQAGDVVAPRGIAAAIAEGYARALVVLRTVEHTAQHSKFDVDP
jgi:2,4-dienoyl-CoA reductase (NADPH2)